MFKHLVELEVPYVLPESFDSALLWNSTWSFCSCDDLRPSWTGFIQDVSTGTHPPLSGITMLPIIDLNPSNETCIYSTLLYVKDQAKQLNVPMICITFDQSLWRKAVEIIDANSMGIVCRLVGFHMMSFLGSIGSIMDGSGLSELLGTVYGQSSVSHLISGNAVSRAVRGSSDDQTHQCGSPRRISEY